MSTIADAFVTDSTAHYDPFGTMTTAPATNPAISNHGFTGHRHNNTGTNNLGLIYMNARYYLPEIGRFISPDTIVPEPENPQSFNRYSYVRNNQMNFTDPTGHREIGANESDLLPHQAPTTTPTLSDVLSPIEPIFDGLPITNIQWTNGFGANSFAYQNAGVYANQSAEIHPGIDFGKNYIDGCDECMTVYANVTGTVVIGVFPGDANPNVVIDLGNGMFVVYGHVHTTIAPGTFVQPGTPIGRLEDQREWSGGKVTRDNTHVHMSLRAAQRTFNPAYFFTDQSILRDFTWNYSPHHSLYSISSYQYTSGKSYWTDPGWTFGLTK